MQLNQFSVRIYPGRELSSGYVAMQHNSQYSINLHNYRAEACDAEVNVDGKSVGTFRIYAGGKITLERPEGDTGKFTFYKLGTPEASKAQLSNDDNLGRISVTFKPAKKSVGVLNTVVQTGQWQGTWTANANWQYNPSYTSRGSSAGVASAGAPAARYGTESLGSGGTGLSGESSQQFYTVGPLDYDESQTTTINLRLVADNNEPRPLTQSSNPVPPRL